MGLSLLAVVVMWESTTDDSEECKRLVTVLFYAALERRPLTILCYSGCHILWQLATADICAALASCRPSTLFLGRHVPWGKAHCIPFILVPLCHVSLRFKSFPCLLPIPCLPNNSHPFLISCHEHSPPCLLRMQKIHQCLMQQYQP